MAKVDQTLLIERFDNRIALTLKLPDIGATVLEFERLSEMARTGKLTLELDVFELAEAENVLVPTS